MIYFQLTIQLFSGVREGKVEPCEHIMLSYEKGCEVLMMKVRQQLLTAGFNVRLGGGASLHEVMRKDVEGAAAVVVAFTRKYKQEPQTFAGNFTSAKTIYNVFCLGTRLSILGYRRMNLKR